MSKLHDLIASRIRQSGPITLAEFMELSLYHPEHGYYSRKAQRTGRGGDFFTSVDVGPVFGELLAKQFAEMWRIVADREGTRPFDLVEAGAGNGRLARDVLDAAQAQDPEFYAAIRLSLVEASPAARAEQKATLGSHAGSLVHSSATLPESVYGVIYANELLDALPTHAVTMTAGGLREIFVALDNGTFVEHLNEPSSPRISDYLSRSSVALKPGWRGEVCLAAEDWVKAAARSLERGCLLLIDYGHDSEELRGDSHAAGTLATFSRHTSPERSGANLLAACLEEPGERDITAHVDLSAITAALTRAGLDEVARLDQTYFMMGLGLDEMMSMADSVDPRIVKRRLALKTLLLPGGLGSTHKVLVFGKGVGKPALKGTSYRTRLT